MELTRLMVAAGLMAMAGGIGALAQDGTQPGSTQPGTSNPNTRYPSQPGRDSTPGMGNQPGQTTRDMPGMRTGQQVTQADLDRVSASWPQASKTALRDMTTKNGLPNSLTPIMAVWQNNGPWKYSIVYGSEVPHSFPAPHTDVLEQFIDFKVPAEKVGDLARFDGSLIVARTPGLLAAWCDKEENNFIAINLANEIVTGKTTVEDARQRLAQEAQKVQQGQTSTLAQSFAFQVEHGNTGDPDQPATNSRTLGTPERIPGMPANPDSNPRPGEPGSTEPKSPSTTPRPGEPSTPPTNPGMPR